MSAQRVGPLAGENYLGETITDCRIAGFDGQHRLAKLSLTIESHLSTDRTPQGATTLEVYVSEEAAIRLIARLDEFSKQMGWPLE
jgi:hypothetical protein